jgi:hypothetical protein
MALSPLPPPTTQVLFGSSYAQPWWQYYQSLDATVRHSPLALQPLVDAANDAGAAAAGVPLNGLYRNGNAVQVRLI